MRGKAGRAGTRGRGADDDGDRRADLFGVVRPGIDLGMVVRMFERGNMAGALRRLDGIIGDRPDSSFLHVNKAMVLIEMDRLGEAEDCCRKALGLDENTDHAHEKMGLIMHMSGRSAGSLPYHDRAIDLCKRVKGANRDLARVYSNKGAALAGMGSMDEAMRCFERSSRADPGYAIAHGNKGALLYQAGSIEDVAECFMAAKRLDPSFVLHLAKD
ncbi:MAG: tetratricopeptide repeat protein [Nitrosopumilaceae archaeon]|nr:tetratricopeptide repeat protein [Nitrosopumilaceae archaeon]